MVSEQLREKIEVSIKRLQSFCPEEGYYLAFSGGKDSIVCKQLLIESGCKFDAHYHVTSVDPPELVRYIKDHHKDVSMDVPRDKDGKPINMWNLIERKLYPPTRLVRYCCQELKESGGEGRMTVTGVRWAESPNRKENQGKVTIMSKDKKLLGELRESDASAQNKKGGIILNNDNEESRRMVEQCYRKRKTTVNPIIEWEDDDVWEFIRDRGLPYCSLYDEGFDRLGCIGCPLAWKSQRVKELERYPKYKNAYMMAFGKMLKERERRGKPNDGKMGNTPKSVYHWWMRDGVKARREAGEEL